MKIVSSTLRNHLARATSVPPRPVLALHDAHKLRDELVAGLGIPCGIQTLQVRDHVVWPPSLTRQEEIGEPCGGVHRQGVDREVRDELGRRVERRRWRVGKQAIAYEKRDVDEVCEFICCCRPPVVKKLVLGPRVLLSARTLTLSLP